MTRAQYLAKRTALLAEAKKMVEANDITGYTAKEVEIKNLDTEYEEAAKAQANLAALQGSAIGATSVPTAFANSCVLTQDNTLEPDGIYASNDYRKAFMNFVVSQKPIPAQFNVDANTKTTDVGTVIPTTIMEKIVEKMEAIGMILPLVTRTGYKGGLAIPTSTVKPVATWVSEGEGSDKQKKTTGSITFSYYKLRCAISMSFETTVVTLGIFESTFANNVADAMVKAKEQTIIAGTGSGQPKGILKETPVNGQALTIAKSSPIKYADLIAAEAALPLEYENGAVWLMTKKSFMAFIAMTDANGQPIARTNYGIAGKPERTLLGRTVVLNNYMDSYTDTVTTDTLFAALFRMEDYLLNENAAITVKRYEDNETDDQVMKAIALVDGKVVDKNSLVTLTKKAS